MARAPGKHECAYCGQRFEKMSHHMTHVLQEHDRGYRERGERLSRPISCWKCGTTDVVPSGDDNWYYCSCGWELPRNWVNGQLVVSEKTPAERSSNEKVQQERDDA